MNLSLVLLLLLEVEADRRRIQGSSSAAVVDGRHTVVDGPRRSARASTSGRLSVARPASASSRRLPRPAAGSHV
jgi:hypothetical protein